MKGAIIIPTFYKNRESMGQVIKHKVMHNELCKKYNFSYLYTDTPNLDKYDIAIIRNVPYHNRPAIPPGLLDTKCKLIGEFGDLQCWDNEECIENKEILFNRYDILMGAFYDRFMEWYPQHINKYIHFPQYFGPYKKYASLPINPNPKMRCVMAGSYGPRGYPIRNYIFEKSITFANNGYIDVSGAGKIPFKEYPEYINSYFCALATGGAFNSAIAKYFEIPAAGTLMLAVEIPELAICGLKPYIHYVPITKEDVFDKVKEVLKNPHDYTGIRDEGTNFVRQNHSDINRVDIFKNVFDRLLSR